MSTNQAAYRALCEREPSIPLFSKDWWLDAVAEEKWDAVTTGKGDQIDAAMPFCMDRKFGFKRIYQPPFTQTLGPWTREIQGSNYNQQSKAHKYTKALIEQLPAFDVFKQNFHPDITDWLPFYWHGFKQTTRYTYILDDLSDHDELWKSLRSNIRTDINKARDIHGLIVKTDQPLSKLINLYNMTFDRQGLAPRQQRTLFERIDTACKARGCSQLFIAEDEDGNAHAAVYIVWDSNRAYYLIGGADPSLRNSGASSFCLWEAIKFASEVTPIFDFEGSMLQPVERFFRAFGATPISFHQVTLHKSRIYNLAHAFLSKR